MEDLFAAIRPIISQNIDSAIARGDFNAKVMPGDAVVTPKLREEVVFKYDINKKKLRSKIERILALIYVNHVTRVISKYTTINGLENALELKGQAFIITGNHYSPYDSLIIRQMTDKMKKKNKLHIIINETNLFMGGSLGKVVKSIDMLPYADDLKYIAKTFTPALQQRIKRKEPVLIYPEQEMWYEYPYPRPLKPGAYHFASKFNVPILPTFTTFNKVSNEEIYYTLHIGKPIYPDPALDYKVNKEKMQEQDNIFKAAFKQLN